MKKEINNSIILLDSERDNSFESYVQPAFEKEDRIDINERLTILEKWFANQARTMRQFSHTEIPSNARGEVV